MEVVLATVPKPARAHGVLRIVVQTLVASAADARLYMESPGFPRLRQLQQREISAFTERIAAEAMPFEGPPKPSVDRLLATRTMVTAATELIAAWLHGDIDTDEDTRRHADRHHTRSGRGGLMSFSPATVVDTFAPNPRLRRVRLRVEDPESLTSRRTPIAPSGCISTRQHRT